MDYCSLCRKACLVKDFWKIYIGLILSLLLKWTFYPQRHMILSSADSFCQALICFFKLSPSPSFSKSFKWISLDSKRHPDFTEVIFFVCLYVIFFLSRAIRNLGFLRCIYMVRNVTCMALPYYWWYKGILWFLDIFLVQVAYRPHWSLPQPHLKHTQPVPPAFSLPLQS